MKQFIEIPGLSNSFNYLFNQSIDKLGYDSGLYGNVGELDTDTNEIKTYYFSDEGDLLRDFVQITGSDFYPPTIIDRKVEVEILDYKNEKLEDLNFNLNDLVETQTDELKDKDDLIEQYL